MNKRSSDRKPSLWSTFTDSLFGAPDTRTNFDHEVDQFIRKAPKKTTKNSKKLQATIEHDLIYIVNSPMFIGELRMGNAGTIINVVYDTGSDWLVVPDSKCVNCNGTLVNSGLSGK